MAREANARAIVSRRAACSLVSACHAAKTEPLSLVAFRRSAVVSCSRCRLLAYTKCRLASRHHMIETRQGANVMC